MNVREMVAGRISQARRTTRLVPPRERVRPVGVIRESKVEEREVTPDYSKMTFPEVVLGLPHVERGESSAMSPGWFWVRFKVKIRRPQVVAVCEMRSTSFVERLIPRVDDITLKTVKRPFVPPISVPKFTDIDVSETVANAARDRCRATLGDWGFFNWMRDGICSVAYAMGKLEGEHLEWLYNVIVKPQLQKIYSDMQVLATNTRGAIQTVSDSSRDAINSVVVDANSKINKQVEKMQDRVNGVLKDLYEMWNIPQGAAVTPAQIRNVTSSGFEWYSYGNTTLHYVAIGGIR